MRVARVDYVSNLPGRSEYSDVADPTSPTGYPRGQRELIVPERHNETYHWIMQTQQMIARGEWRVRHVDYDNAPDGREVRSTSPYRWWLGGVAWIHHLVSGQPIGLSVERAVLYADPVLLLALMIATTVFAARRFGPVPTAMLALGMATLFPFAAGFLPGIADDHALAQVCIVASVLPLLTNVATSNSKLRRRDFTVAGVAGGIGLWVNPVAQGPVLAGILGGALAAAWIMRGATDDARAPATEGAPWRAWALAGAITTSIGYALEYVPNEIDLMRVTSIHPAWALAWLGAGDAIARASAWITNSRRGWRGRDSGMTAAAGAMLIAVVVLPFVVESPGMGASDPLRSRLSGLPDSTVAGSFFEWMARDVMNAKVLAVVLPLGLLVTAGWILGRSIGRATDRAALALALGPVVAMIPLACLHLPGWRLLDAALLASVAAIATLLTTDPASTRMRRWGAGFAAVVLLAGVLQLRPPTGDHASRQLTRLEAEELVARDLAHWLARRVGGQPAVVLAPPAVSTSMSFYGGLRSIATYADGNKQGIEAAFAIAGKVEMDEAAVLMDERKVSHVVLPSWDRHLDELARAGSSQPENSITFKMRSWTHPFWLRAVPYPLPGIPGFEDESAAVFEVVEEPDEATGLSHLAEYFLEMGQFDLAGSMVDALAEYPTDLSALIARAQIAAAYRDEAGRAAIFESLVPLVESGLDGFLPWDRRVSLAGVLAAGKQTDLARIQAEHCLAELDEINLRSLTTGSLFRLLYLCKVSGLRIEDGNLHALALELLPPEMRQRL